MPNTNSRKKRTHRSCTNCIARHWECSNIYKEKLDKSSCENCFKRELICIESKKPRMSGMKYKKHKNKNKKKDNAKISTQQETETIKNFFI